MREKGSALILVIITLSIISILGLSILTTAFFENLNSIKDYQSTSAKYVSESGIEFVNSLIYNQLATLNNLNINLNDFTSIINQYILTPLQNSINLNKPYNIDNNNYYLYKYFSIDTKNYTIKVASEGHTGRQVYTTYADLTIDITSNKPITINQWIVKKGLYNPRIQY